MIHKSVDTVRSIGSFILSFLHDPSVLYGYLSATSRWWIHHTDLLLVVFPNFLARTCERSWRSNIFTTSKDEPLVTSRYVKQERRFSRWIIFFSTLFSSLKVRRSYNWIDKILVSVRGRFIQFFPMFIPHANRKRIWATMCSKVDSNSWMDEWEIRVTIVNLQRGEQRSH